MKLYYFSLASIAAVAVWSYFGPSNDFIWFMEAFAVLFGVPILVVTREKFKLTPLVYCLLYAHAVVLLVGACYTYAEVPLFNWLRDEYALSRNHYDRLGHFFQGAVPAILARELLLRTSPLRAGWWLFTIVSLSCLGISALYEILEWATAAHTGDAANAFLGAQGDEWDTQKDMALAFIGAVLAQLGLSRWHDRQLKAV